jgi:hypothetical protein
VAGFDDGGGFVDGDGFDAGRVGASAAAFADVRFGGVGFGGFGGWAIFGGSGGWRPVVSASIWARRGASRGVTRLMTTPARPARAVRPTRCR